jgi:hypothetical protein
VDELRIHIDELVLDGGPPTEGVVAEALRAQLPAALLDRDTAAAIDAVAAALPTAPG